MTTFDPTESIKHLATFDKDEFSSWCRVSRLVPSSDKSMQLAFMAISHTEEAEGLLMKAVQRMESGGGVGKALEALTDGVKIRLAAAAHCRNLSGVWASMHARYDR